MKIFQWLLVIFGLFCVLGSLASGTAPWVSIILFAIATLIVFPPVEDELAGYIKLLESSFIKLFLYVVLVIVGISLDVSGSAQFTALNICNQPSSSSCPQHDIAFLEGTQALSFSAGLSADGLTVDKATVNIDYWAEAGDPQSFLQQELDVQANQTEQLFQLTEVTLMPGHYRLTLRPKESEDYGTVSTEARFSVWTDEADVTSRQGQEVRNARVSESNSLASLRACEGTGNSEDSCEEHFTQLSADINILHLTAELPGVGERVSRSAEDSTLTMMLRYLGEADAPLEEPEVIFRETETLEPTIGTFTLMIEDPRSFIGTGNFELLGFLETPASHPVRKLFSLTEPNAG